MLNLKWNYLVVLCDFFLVVFGWLGIGLDGRELGVFRVLNLLGKGNIKRDKRIKNIFEGVSWGGREKKIGGVFWGGVGGCFIEIKEFF